MPPPKSFFRRKLQPREIRWLIYLAVVLAVGAWRFMPRPWHSTLILETPHHKIFSTATRQQVEDTAHALERLYTAYSNRLGSVSGWTKAWPNIFPPAGSWPTNSPWAGSI